MLDLALWLMLILFLAIPTLVSFFRGATRSALRLIIWIIGIPVAVLITNALASSLATLVTPIVETALAGTGFGSFNGTDTLIELVSSLTMAAIAPIAFISSYFIAECVLVIVYKIFNAIFKKKLKDIKIPLTKNVSRAIGAACGLLIGLTLIVGFYGTLAGHVELVYDEACEYLEATDAADPTAVELEILKDEYLEPMAKHPMTRLSLALGGRAAWKSIAVVRFDGESESLHDTADALVHTITALEHLSGPVSEYGDEEKLAIHNAIDAINETVVFAPFMAEVLAGFGSSWLAGEDYLGVAPITTGNAALDDLVVDFLEVLATSTRDTVKGDLDALADIFALCIDKGVFSAYGSSDALMEIVTADGFISSLTTILYSDEHLAPLAPAVIAFGAKSALGGLGIPEDGDALYDNFLDEIVAAILRSPSLDSAERAIALRDELIVISDKYSLDLTDVDCALLADGMIAEFGDRDSIDSKEVEEFIAVYNYVNKGILPGTETAAPAFPGYILISNTNATPIAKSGDEETLASLGYSSWEELIAKYPSAAAAGSTAAAINGKTNKEALDTLGDAYGATADAISSSKDTTVSTTTVNINRDDVANREGNLTLKDIGNIMKSADLTSVDIEKEAQLIESAFTSMVSLFATFKDGGSDAFMEGLDGLVDTLDKLNETALLGGDTLKKLLEAMITSPSFISSTGASTADIRTLVSAINETVDDGASYADAMSGIGAMTDYVGTLGDKEATVEEKEAAVNEMLLDMNSVSLASLNAFVTPELLEGNGVPEKNSAAIAELSRAVFRKLYEYKAVASKAQYQKEAKAVNALMGVFFDSASGELVIDESWLTVVVDSVVIMQVLDSYTGGGTVYDPISLGIDTADLTKIADAIVAQASIHPEKFTEYKIIAAFFGIGLSLP